MSDHKTIFGKLFASLGGALSSFFGHALKGAETSFNELTPDQQTAVINGTGISQFIKLNYAKGEAFIVDGISKQYGLSPEITTAAILAIGKEVGVDTGKVQDVLNHFADKVQAGLTDGAWNALWENAAKFATTYLTTGKLDFTSLGFGVILYALHKYIH